MSEYFAHIFGLVTLEVVKSRSTSSTCVSRVQKKKSSISFEKKPKKILIEKQ